MTPRCCPTCRQPWPTAEAAEAAMVAKLQAACSELGILVDWEASVSEADAARLLGRSLATLRNRRGLDCPIAFMRRGNRIRYTLQEIARYLASENNCD